MTTRFVTVESDLCARKERTRTRVYFVYEEVMKWFETNGQHYCSSECPESKVFEEHDYQLKEMQRKLLLTKKKEI